MSEERKTEDAAGQLHGLLRIVESGGSPTLAMSKAFVRLVIEEAKALPKPEANRLRREVSPPVDVEAVKRGTEGRRWAEPVAAELLADVASEIHGEPPASPSGAPERVTLAISPDGDIYAWEHGDEDHFTRVDYVLASKLEAAEKRVAEYAERLRERSELYSEEGERQRERIAELEARIRELEAESPMACELDGSRLVIRGTPDAIVAVRNLEAQVASDTATIQGRIERVRELEERLADADSKLATARADAMQESLDLVDRYARNAIRLLRDTARAKAGPPPATCVVCGQPPHDRCPGPSPAAESPDAAVLRSELFRRAEEWIKWGGTDACDALEVETRRLRAVRDAAKEAGK